MKGNQIIPERTFCLNQRIIAYNFMQKTNKQTKQTKNTPC